MFFSLLNINLKSVSPVNGSTEAPPDAILSFRILKHGGIMAFDDYLLGIRYPNTPGSKAMNGSCKNAIDYFTKLFGDELEIIHKDYQLWIRKNV